MLGLLGTLAGCNAIVGLDKIEIVPDQPTAGKDSGGGGSDDEGGSGGLANSGTGGDVIGDGGGDAGSAPVGDCVTNQECTDRLTTAGVGVKDKDGKIAGACIQEPAGHCVALLSEDCDTITGDYTQERAIFIGSLFSTKGATAPTNIQRQQAAMLGVEQINTGGGIPDGATSANPRQLVMVSCDESTDLVRAATHLVSEIQVPAIVGPNTSQDTLDVSTKVTVGGKTVVMTPTGVASSIAGLTDQDLTWMMAPSDLQRAPLMIDQINDLEAQLKADRMLAAVKLGIVFRDDALGRGTRSALDDLKLNGKPLVDASNLNKNVSIDPYVGSAADQTAIVNKYVSFAPDIIVLAGTAEAITKVLVPLEKAWTAPNRPFYILIDSTKVPDLLAAATDNDDLRVRVRGTGITPGAGAPSETNNSFLLDYSVRFNTPATTSGMGASHDAAYSIGLALAATYTEPPSGPSVVKGLRMLAGGATTFKAIANTVRTAVQTLSSGEKVNLVGTFGMLDWDKDGLVKGGTLEMWCIGGPISKPVYGSSKLTQDLATGKQTGTYTQCPL